MTDEDLSKSIFDIQSTHIRTGDLVIVYHVRTSHPSHSEFTQNSIKLRPMFDVFQVTRQPISYRRHTWSNPTFKVWWILTSRYGGRSIRFKGKPTYITLPFPSFQWSKPHYRREPEPKLPIAERWFQRLMYFRVSSLVHEQKDQRFYVFTKTDTGVVVKIKAFSNET